MAEFVKVHNMVDMEPPCVIAPGTNHYSWPKSATTLGLGDQNIIHVTVDGYARQNLEGKLLYFLFNHIS